jgi:hypothetical protein
MTPSLDKVLEGSILVERRKLLHKTQQVEGRGSLLLSPKPKPINSLKKNSMPSMNKKKLWSLHAQRPRITRPSQREVLNQEKATYNQGHQHLK